VGLLYSLGAAMLGTDFNTAREKGRHQKFGQVLIAGGLRQLRLTPRR
jgi:hypothetical protein